MIQIGHKPENVGNEPLEHLVACHDRILARLDTLTRVSEAFQADSQAAIQALRNVIRFFDISGRLHTEDEEESVFPRLRRRLSAEQVSYIDGLESQHREKEAVYEDLKKSAAELERGVTADAVEHFRRLAVRLGELYRAHIASENDILVSLGRSALSREELDSIREEMQARRAPAG